MTWPSWLLDGLVSCACLHWADRSRTVPVQVAWALMALVNIGFPVFRAVLR